MCVRVVEIANLFVSFAVAACPCVRFGLLGRHAMVFLICLDAVMTMKLIVCFESMVVAFVATWVRQICLFLHALLLEDLPANLPELLRHLCQKVVVADFVLLQDLTEHKLICLVRDAMAVV